MIHYTTGNLLSSEDMAIVNTVNTVGIMGKGIALQFKEAYPENYRLYRVACQDKRLDIGQLFITTERDKMIINFPTKRNWKYKSKYEYIEEGLRELAIAIDHHNIKSLSLPPLGCGNGGLTWGRVKMLIEQYLGEIEGVEINVYEPNEAVGEILIKESGEKEAKLTPARALLLYAMFYYESLGENSSLFVANKLVYFMQRLGENTYERLKFTASHYGPYCPQVVHLLYSINGKYLKGLEQMSPKPFAPLYLQHQRITEISNYVKNDLGVEQRDRLRRVVELITGFQSALSLEILASVDFVMKENPNIDQATAIRLVQAWSPRKRNLFKEEYIIIAHNRLLQFSSSNTKPQQ